MINSASNSKEIFDLIAKEEKTGTIGFSSISKESIFNTVVPLYVFERLFTCIIFEKVYSVIC